MPLPVRFIGPGAAWQGRVPIHPATEVLPNSHRLIGAAEPARVADLGPDDHRAQPPDAVVAGQSARHPAWRRAKLTNCARSGSISALNSSMRRSAASTCCHLAADRARASASRPAATGLPTTAAGAARPSTPSGSRRSASRTHAGIAQKKVVVCVLVPLSQVMLMFQFRNSGIAGTITRSYVELAGKKKLRTYPSELYVHWAATPLRSLM